MVSSLFQLPPNGFGASASVCGSPPARSTRFSLKPAKNPIEREFGDQNGLNSPRWIVWRLLAQRGARHNARHRRIQRPNPKVDITRFVRSPKCDLSAVGRQRWSRPRLETSVRRKYRQPHRFWTGWSLPKMNESENNCSQNGDDSHSTPQSLAAVFASLHWRGQYRIQS
jgi:hypothetical protein